MGRSDLVYESMIGQKYGKWLVKSLTTSKKYYADCQCECGTRRSVFIPNLINGKSRSCNCSKREIKHGMSQTRFYNIWKNILRRIDSPYASGYSNYGGRGISISKEWRSFDLFKSDMYERYLAHVSIHGEKNTTIERKDVNGDYCPENCKWATLNEQGINKRDSKRYLINNESLTPREISEKFNLKYVTVVYRLSAGWPAEKVILQPLGIGRRASWN